jgi:hypothetical protein
MRIATHAAKGMPQPGARACRDRRPATAAPRASTSCCWPIESTSWYDKRRSILRSFPPQLRAPRVSSFRLLSSPIAARCAGPEAPAAHAHPGPAAVRGFGLRLRSPDRRPPCPDRGSSCSTAVDRRRTELQPPTQGARSPTRAPGPGAGAAALMLDRGRDFRLRLPVTRSPTRAPGPGAAAAALMLDRGPRRRRGLRAPPPVARSPTRAPRPAAAAAALMLDRGPRRRTSFGLRCPHVPMPAAPAALVARLMPAPWRGPPRSPPRRRPAPPRGPGATRRR